MVWPVQAEEDGWAAPADIDWFGDKAATGSSAQAPARPGSYPSASQRQDAGASEWQAASLASSNPRHEGQQADQFSKHAIWRVTLPAAGTSICYDFDSTSVVPDCKGSTWDLKLQSGRRVLMLTNSGANGQGRAGVYAPHADATRAGMHPWKTLLRWKSANHDPEGRLVPDHLFAQDRLLSAFSGRNRIRSAIFEHALAGSRLPHDQRFYPSYRVFLVNSDVRNTGLEGNEQAPVFALQVIGYYGDSGHDEGHVQLRWVDRRAPANLRQATIDSSRGWVYLDLATGKSSNVDDGHWHIAFKQHHVRLRGGDSARGKGGRVGGMIGMTSPRLYDISGRPKATALMNAQPDDFLADLTSRDLDLTPGNWMLDRVESSLSPRLMMTVGGSLDFGWYVEQPAAGQTHAAGLPAVAGLRRAMPERGALVRSAEGNSYARVQLRSIDYQDPGDPQSPQTWTFDLAIQPAASE
ncbi:MAG: HmuY family protein [Lautropia sp.]|nr:HmuY family protein [Lautropia sp.]